ncbi:MAG: hypothetical protein HYY18_22765 [Planctomycetes bacterium]|nr:hypothetical protein [Planctomycetota bacterium]
MKRLALALALGAAPLLSACGSSYDAYRSDGVVYIPDEGDASTAAEPASGPRRTRPGASVVYASDYQGGTGPGSYGGTSRTIVRETEGGLIIEGDRSRR